jgi:hypothetical protein
MMHDLRSSLDRFSASKMLYAVFESGNIMQEYMAIGRIHGRSNSLASLIAPKWSYTEGSKKPGEASHLSRKVVYTDERWSSARRRKMGTSYLVLVRRMPATILKEVRAGGGRKNLGNYISVKREY